MRTCCVNWRQRTRRSYFTRIFPICGATCSSARRRSRRAVQLCACGIPTVCFAFADNQLEFAEEMAEHNLLIYAGDVREKDDAPHVICENLVCYTKDAGKRAQSFERMRRLVDGKGAERIAAFLQQYKRDV